VGVGGGQIGQLSVAVADQTSAVAAAWARSASVGARLGALVGGVGESRKLLLGVPFDEQRNESRIFA
jgi:hypothetical protein